MQQQSWTGTSKCRVLTRRNGVTEIIVEGCWFADSETPTFQELDPLYSTSAPAAAAVGVVAAAAPLP